MAIQYIFCIDYSGGLIFCVQPEVRHSLFSFIPCWRESSWIIIQETDTPVTCDIVSAGSECMFPSASRSLSLLEVITSAANASICLVLRFQPLIRSSHAHWAGPELNSLSSCQDHRVFRGINEYAVIHKHIYAWAHPLTGGTHSHTGTEILEDVPRGLKYLSFNKRGQQELYAATPFFLGL